MDVYSSKLSHAVDVGVGAYLLVIAVLSIIGNLLVLIMASKRSKHMKPAELLSVSLAVTDLGAAVTMYPLAAASAWNHHWIGGDVTCRYYGFMGFFFGIASMATLTVMAVVRFIVSTNLQSPKERVSMRNAKLLVVGAWLYALLWAVFPFAGWGQYGPEPFGLSCTLSWANMRHIDHGFSFVISMFSMNLATPAVVIITCYAGIALRLRVTFKSINSFNHLPNAVKMQKRLVLIAIFISMGFLGSWTPYGMVSLWSVYSDSTSIPPMVSMLPCLFAKTSTVYNPLIYYIFSKAFKTQVKQLCCPYRWSNACNQDMDSNKAIENTVYLVCNDAKPPQPRPRMDDKDLGTTEQMETRLTLEYQ
ncbi:opsin 8, group member b [Alosa sapidissima]|uniref:opsin 8, group member b n=1 Tax=Alosa sapidissima TaxID=34773 RepID=UPI001C098145|nr:opsin 8, group member b [Alosa sapidissima]